MDRSVRLVVITLLLVAVMLTFVVGLDTRAFVGRPFHGLPLLANGTLSARAFVPPAKQAAVATLHPEDRVLAAGGEDVRTAEDVWRTAEKAGIGALVRYRIARPGATELEIEVPVTRFTAGDFRQLFGLFVAAGLAFLAVASIPVLIRPDLLTARLLFLAFWGGTLNFLLLAVDFFFAHRFTPWLRGGGFLMMASLLHLGLLFPEPRWPLRAHPRATVLVIYLVATSLALLSFACFWQPGPLLGAVDVFELGGLGLGAVILLANIVATALRSPDPQRRQQAWVALPAPALTALAVLIFLLSSWDAFPFQLHPIAYPAPLLPAVVLLAYAVVKNNVFEFDAVVRRSLTFAVLMVAGAAIYASVLLFAARYVGALAATALPVAVVLLLIPAVPSLRGKVEDVVENLLFPGQRRARESIRDASRELVRLRDSIELALFVGDVVRRSLSATRAQILTGKPDEPLEVIGERQHPWSIAPDDPLYALLSDGRSLNLDTDTPRRGRLARARERAVSLAMPMIVALPPADDLIGGILLGPRADGRLYTQDDQVLLETFAAQTAVAIENARMWDELRELQRRLAEENVYLREAAESGVVDGEIVGKSVAIGTVLSLVQQVAPTDSSVLVQGETGTGKELVVAAIHRLSRRADRPLVKVACAALPEPLLESELFGHQRGAFTGAVGPKVGRFELADGGTIFFDDVDTLPLAVQAKLLRAVQEGEIQRLGDNEVRIVDVRLIAATNRDLFAEVQAGRFREDLYYRLNVVPITIPPLRQRPEDIPLLVEHFVHREGGRLGRQVKAIAPDTLAQLQAHHWPGNVRELRNVIERALVLGAGEVLRLAAPIDGAGLERPTPPAGAEVGSASLAELLRRYKIRLITEALTHADGNQRIAAEILGMHRPSLTRMIRDLDLEVPARTLKRGR